MPTDKLKEPSKFAIIETARVYSLNPQRVKARAFAYFDSGFSAGETSLLLKPNVNPRTIRTYYGEWKDLRYKQEPSPEYEPAGILALSSAEAAKEETPSMTSNNNEPATKADLRIMELERNVIELTSQVQEARTAHQPFKTNLAHVGNCPNCRHDLEEYNKNMIIKAIEGLSVEAIRDIGFERGAFPRKFTLPGSPQER